MISLRCDRHGCTHAVTVTHDATERQLTEAARVLGWQVKQGTTATTHHCPVHREVKP